MTPLRTCIGCRTQAPSEALVRVVRSPDGELRLGAGLPGRGAWLCDGSPSCAEQAARRGAFGRALRAPTTPEAVDRLLRTLRTTAGPRGGGRQVCEDGVPAGRVARARPDVEKGS